MEPTFLPPFPTPALGVHDHRRPRLESAHPPEVGAASDTGAGHQLRHRESVLRFSELARPSGTGPLSSSQTLPYWKAIRHRWVLRHLAPGAPIRHYPDCNPPETLGTDTCRRTVEYLAFFAELGGRPPDLRHQFGRPQALDALPPSLIRRSGMSRGIQGGHQPSMTFAGSPDSAWSSCQWSKALMAMTSTDELRPDPNPVR